MADIIIPTKEELYNIRYMLSYDPLSGLIKAKYKHGVGAGSKNVGDVMGGVSGRGYRRIQFDHRRYYAHRIAWYLHYNVWPDKVIDHIDGDRSNNRINNLRLVTIGENSRAYRSPYQAISSSSRFRGVCKFKTHVNFCAKVKYLGADYYVGSYPSELEAALAWNIKATELGFAPEAMNKVFEDV